MEAQRSEVTYTRSHSNDSGKGPEFRCLDSLALTLAAVAHITPKPGGDPGGALRWAQYLEEKRRTVC